MDSLLDMRSAVQSDLNVGSGSTLFPPATIDLALNRAYRKIGGLHLWPETEDAKKTSTELNQEYYDYPDNWRPDSIWKVKVDGTDLGDPLFYKDYLYEREGDYPSGQKTLWSSQWRRIFIVINGVPPTSNGDNNIEVWGQKVIDEMVADEDTTIFSHSMPEVNEAVILEAVAILKVRASDAPAILRRYISGSQLLSIEAKQIVESSWEFVKRSQDKYKKTLPMFDSPNFFNRSIKSAKKNIGGF